MKRKQQIYRALGSEVVVTLVSTETTSYVDSIFNEIKLEITQFEKQFSRFLTDSELTEFNNKSGKQTTISNSFRDLLLASKNMSLKTEGLYNPFILPSLQRAGYLNSWNGSITGSKLTEYTSRDVVSADHLIVGQHWAKIPKNSALDFGGIGKGYLLDQISIGLSRKKISGYWISLGGDIVCLGNDLEGKPWSITVANATKTEEIADSLVNKSGTLMAVATSGVTKRKGIKLGKAWHHIIDPKTAQPALTKVLTATVTAKLAVIADVYAKCIVIAGPEVAERYKKQGAIQDYLIQIAEEDSIIEETN